jgi:chromosome segregation ATPase
MTTRITPEQAREALYDYGQAKCDYGMCRDPFHAKEADKNADEYRATVLSFIGQTEALDSEVEQFSRDRYEASMRAERCACENARLRAEVERLEIDRFMLACKAESLERENARLESDADQKLADWTAVSESFRAEIAQLRAQLAEVQRNAEQVVIAELRERVAELENGAELRDAKARVTSAA